MGKPRQGDSKGAGGVGKQALKKTALEKQARVQMFTDSARGGGGTGQRAHEWLKDLGETENVIRELDETIIPELAAGLDTLHLELGEALKSIRATWEDPVAPDS